MYTLNITFPDYDQLKLYIDRLGSAPTTEDILKAAKTPAKIETRKIKSDAMSAEAELKVEDGAITEIKISTPGVEGSYAFTDVKQAILDLAKAKGRNASLEVLKQFQDKNGVVCEKVTAVKEADYAKLIGEVQKVIA